MKESVVDVLDAETSATKTDSELTPFALSARGLSKLESELDTPVSSSQLLRSPGLSRTYSDLDTRVFRIC